MAVRKIASDTLDFILASCKASHPREFGALLEAEGDTIINIIYLPGTDSTSRSVSIKTWMMPNMPHAGSVHSHPSGAIRPSEQDLIFFRANEVNIIVGEPYTRESWKVFDRNGNLTALEIVEYDFGEDEWLQNEILNDAELKQNGTSDDNEFD
ncbi:MAG: Mov34/MPN/PAD-1 family protein [Methanimicrococcus sp.]|nr:Mov34/MPN/PAD-1 family protein [Methanimicrococcus sp.]